MTVSPLHFVILNKNELHNKKRPAAGFAAGLRGSEIDSLLERMKGEQIPEVIQEEVPGLLIGVASESKVQIVGPRV